MELQQLWIYPVKSAQGISLEQSMVLGQGLNYDRQWMIVNAAGKFITQRQYPQLAKLAVAIAGDHLHLTMADHNPLELPLAIYNEENLISVEVWRDRVKAIDQGELAGQWLQQVLDLPEQVKLVRLAPTQPRAIDPQYATAPGQSVSFADGYPCLITNTASLGELNDRLAPQGERITMDRFRPNLVIETDQPFAEDQWQQLKVGSVTFALVKPCSRCIVTTTDQKTGQRNPQREPLATLSTFRQQPGGIMFGVNAIPLNTGSIAVGDRVEILTTT